MCATCRDQAYGLNACATRRQALRVFGASAVGLAFVGSGWAKEVQAPPKPQNVLSPDASLQRLIKGNERYVAGEARRHDFKHEREALVGGQNPYAGILSCADSRIAPEYAFDSGRGDLFVCRVAGNFANDDTVAVWSTLSPCSARLSSWCSATIAAVLLARQLNLLRRTSRCRATYRPWLQASLLQLMLPRGVPAISSTLQFGKMWSTMLRSLNLRRLFSTRRSSNGNSA